MKDRETVERHSSSRRVPYAQERFIDAGDNTNTCLNYIGPQNDFKP